LLGKAVGDPLLFERKRTDAQTTAKFAELKDARKLASLPCQPLLPAGSVQLPAFVYSWLAGTGAYQGAWT
jgi:hypothetical protein